MTQATAAERRAEGPLLTREMTVGAVDGEARTFDVVWSTGAPVKRRDWWSGTTFTETLRLDAASVRLDRLNSGNAPFLDNHDSWTTDARFGVIVEKSAAVDGKEGRARIRMVSAGIDPHADMVFAKIQDGILRSVSVGYVVHTWEEVRKDDVLVSREAVDWEPYEISVVSIPADPQAGVRSSARTFACTIRALPAQEEVTMTTAVSQPAGQSTPEATTEQTEAQRAAAAFQVRAAEFTRAAKGLGLSGDEALAALARGISADDWRREVIDARADADRATPTSTAHVVRDERETRMAGIEDALVAQLTRAKPSDNGARFMESRSIVEFVADAMGERRIPSGFGRREDFLRRAFHTTSDFPLLLESALNKSLAARYAMAMPTYRKIARQRTYQDFRDHNSVRVGDFPTLQSVDSNGGELKNGTFSESKEKTAVSAYGVRVNLSRQLLVNDTLDGITQVLNDRGNAVARFEESTFYAMMISGSSSNGPTLLETGRQVFNSTDVTLAGTPSTIDVTNLSIARAALRKKTSMDGAKLDIVGNVLLVGPDKETVAQQVVAPIMPALPTSPNPFSGKLEVVVTAHITGNPWYVFADPSVAPCFEWGLLDGYTAPRFRMEEIFGVQGTQLSLEHDFGCGAIDFRGGFRNAGA